MRYSFDSDRFTKSLNAWIANRWPDAKFYVSEYYSGWDLVLPYGEDANGFKECFKFSFGYMFISSNPESGTQYIVDQVNLVEIFLGIRPQIVWC